VEHRFTRSPSDGPTTVCATRSATVGAKRLVPPPRAWHLHARTGVESRSRRHPIPDLVQIVLQIGLNASMDCPSTPGAPCSSRNLLEGSQTSRFEYRTTCLSTSARPRSSSRMIRLTERTTATDDPAPSSALITRASSLLRAGPPARPRDGTQSLTFCPLETLPLATHSGSSVGVRLPRSTRKQQISLTSPPCRTPPGQINGTRQALPEIFCTPRFRCQLIRFRHFNDDRLLIPT